MKTSYFSVKGERKENEDYILSKQINKDVYINLIADGMGGYENGKLAAETVANSIFEFLSENIDDLDKYELINRSISRANNAIKELYDKNNKALGSTIGGCLTNGNHAFIFWVGDVKIIHVRNNKIIFESEDHSLINGLKKSGNISNDVNLDSIRHIVLKSIKGEATKYKPDIKEIQVKLNDKIVVCSDGILDKTKLEDIAAMNFEVEKTLEDLKSRYSNNSDNSSLIVLEF